MTIEVESIRDVEGNRETDRPKNPPPVAKFRVGAVQGSIWRLSDGYPSVSFERSYKNKEGGWKTAHNYDIGALAELRVVIDLAETRLKELYKA